MRPATSTERARVAAALDVYGPRVLERVLARDKCELWARDEGKDVRVSLVGAALAARLHGLAPPAGPGDAGLLLGTLGRRGFTLSLPGAADVAALAARGRVVVKEKTAQLFLYGRDVLGHGVVRVKGTVTRGDVVLVTTRAGDTLGLGRVVGAFRGPARAIEPIADLGWYLREGG